MTSTKLDTTNPEGAGYPATLAAPLANTVTGRSASYREARALAAYLRRSHTDRDAYAVFILPLDGWYVKTASHVLAAKRATS